MEQEPNKIIRTYKVKGNYLRKDGTVVEYTCDRPYIVTHSRRGRPSKEMPQEVKDKINEYSAMGMNGAQISKVVGFSPYIVRKYMRSETQ